MLKGPPHLLDREVLHTSLKFSIPLIKIRNFSKQIDLKIREKRFNLGGGDQNKTNYRYA